MDFLAISVLILKVFDELIWLFVGIFNLKILASINCWSKAHDEFDIFKVCQIREINIKVRGFAIFINSDIIGRKKARTAIRS